VNGVSPNSQQLQSISAFVAQEDVLMGSATPLEALNFAAKMRLPHLTEKARSDMVEEILTDLGLWRVRNNFIGFSGAEARNSGIKRGLSGGERKRVSIAIELITNPKLIFLDEPTSGLDSFAAKTVLDVLRQLAFMGRTVLCTIHQPSADIFRLLDDLMILAEGDVVYFGKAANAIPYFDKIGFKCPPYRNPADYLIKILHVDPGEDKMTDESALKQVDKGQVQRLIKKYKKSKLCKAASNPPEPPQDFRMGAKPQRASVLTQFGALIKRTMLLNVREPVLLKGRIVQAIFLAIIAGLVYLRVDNDQVGIVDRVGALFFITVSTAFGSINGPTHLFPAERAVFARERMAGMYGTLVYYLAKVISEIPINLFIPIISATVAYVSRVFIIFFFCDCRF